jgi:hypothetical protein
LGEFYKQSLLQLPLLSPNCLQQLTRDPDSKKKKEKPGLDPNPEGDGDDHDRYGDDGGGEDGRFQLESHKLEDHPLYKTEFLTKPTTMFLERRDFLLA